MNKALENCIKEICSTKMPDNNYPAFSLFKSQDVVEIHLSWNGLDVAVISSEEDEAIKETIIAFTSICTYIFERS